MYCFARQVAVDDVAVAGIDGRSSVESLEVNDITAVFCEVDLVEFRAAVAAEDGVDPAWLLPRACRHEQIIKAVLARSPVLPIRFGAVFSSRQALERLLAEPGPT